MTSFRKDYTVDILIRGWGNIDLTRKLIASIIRNTPAPTYQIIYVDNGSNKSELTALIAEFPGLTYISLPFNHGSVRAINAGLTIALLCPSPYIVLMDNDTEVPYGDVTWLQRLINPFADEKVGAVGAVSDYVSGPQNCEALPDVFQKSFSEHGQTAYDTMPAIPVLVSFAMALRKSAVQVTGLFDETFEPGNAEDYDYTLRLIEKGYTATIANSVWIHHKGSQTFKRFNLVDLVNSNMEKLVTKWTVKRLEEFGIQIQ